MIDDYIVVLFMFLFFLISIFVQCCCFYLWLYEVDDGDKRMVCSLGGSMWFVSLGEVSGVCLRVVKCVCGYVVEAEHR